MWIFALKNIWWIISKHIRNKNTPLVRLNNVTKDIPALVLAKIESFNPGNSVKDRMALKWLRMLSQMGTKPVV